MTDMAWIDLPDFTDGEILSASKVNILHNDCEVLAGLLYSKEWPIPTSRYPNTEEGQPGDPDIFGFTGIYWGGVVHNPNADTLVVVATTPNAETFTVSYNDQEIGSGLSGGTHNLDISGLSLDDWTAYEVFIELDGDGLEWWEKEALLRDYYDADGKVRYVYETGTEQTVPSPPAFTNATLSSADDFNDVVTGLAALRTDIRQGINGCIGAASTENYFHLNDTYADWRTVRRWSIMHWHNRLYVSASVRWNKRSTSSGYTMESRLRYRDISTNAVTTVYSSSNEINNTSGWTDISSTVTGLDAYGLVVGTWYEVTYEIGMFYGGSPSTRVENEFDIFSFRYFYEFSPTLPGTYTDLENWEHGDLVDGTGGSTPELSDLSDNIDLMEYRHRFLNPVQRYLFDGSGDHPHERTNQCHYQVRQYRWLTYQAYDADTDVSLEYYDGSEWQSTSLDSSETSEWFDLAGSPVVEGMLFRILNAKFAMQSPEYGS